MPTLQTMRNLERLKRINEHNFMNSNCGTEIFRNLKGAVLMYAMTLIFSILAAPNFDSIHLF